MNNNMNFYDEWAKNYDFGENSTIHIDEIYFPKLWNNIFDKNIIEIGCGSGRHTQKLAKNSNNICAIDLSSKMQEIAKEKIKSNNVNFICGDFMNIEIAPNSFDFAICALVLEHIENLAPIFAKISHTIKNGGSFFLSEIHPFRMQNGSGARFINENGQEIRATSFCHIAQDFEECAKTNGLEIVQKHEIYGTSELKNINKSWSKYNNTPMLLIYEFKKPNP
jgi:2-polyprenyl-3-methyl-5-hydroxy-6-metoxy-1,4-benzoquinol methylase